MLSTESVKSILPIQMGGWNHILLRNYSVIIVLIPFKLFTKLDKVM